MRFPPLELGDLWRCRGGRDGEGDGDSETDKVREMKGDGDI